MASKEELKAMGIKVMQCRECCRDITEEEYKKYDGYCKNCYINRESIEEEREIYNDSTEEETVYDDGINKIAKTIKIIAITLAVLSIIASLILREKLGIILLIASIIVSIISSIFIYALGEIIQKLQNIEDNTKREKI